MPFGRRGLCRAPVFKDLNTTILGIDELVWYSLIGLCWLFWEGWGWDTVGGFESCCSWLCADVWKFFAAYSLDVLFIYHSHSFQLICHALTVETFDLFCLIYTVCGFKALRVASALWQFRGWTCFFTCKHEMPAMPATPHPYSEVEDPHLICGAPPKSLIERGLVRFFILFFWSLKW